MGIEHVLTEDADVAASRGQEAGQHFDRRGLARAVRAKKPIERAALDSEFDRVHGAEVAEVAGQLMSFDGEGHRCVDILVRLAATRGGTLSEVRQLFCPN